MRRSQIHQPPVNKAHENNFTGLEFVTHSNRARCQFFAAFRLAGPENSGLVRFVSRQNEHRIWFEIKSKQ